MILFWIPAMIGLMVVASPASDTISLAGKWRFQLDRFDAGLRENWAAQELPDRIRLPGSLPAQDVGDDVTTRTPWTGGIVDRSFFTSPEFEKYRQPGKIKLPFWLTPEKYYAGVAWYQREIKIPDDWIDKRVVLTLERPHWETRVWVDDRIYGTNDSLEHAARIRSWPAVAGPAHTDHPRGQPPHRGHRRKFPQHQRPHARQLERHRRRHFPARHAAGVD